MAGVYWTVKRATKLYSISHFVGWILITWSIAEFGLKGYYGWMTIASLTGLACHVVYMLQTRNK